MRANCHGPLTRWRPLGGQGLYHEVEAASGCVGGRDELVARQVLPAGHQALVLGRVRRALHVHQERRRHQVRRRLRLLVQGAAQGVTDCAKITHSCSVWTLER